MSTYRSGRPGRTQDRIEARKRIRRGAHDLVLVMQQDDTAPTIARQMVKATRWLEDLRRNRTTIYGALFRYLDIAIARGVPRSTLLLIPDTIRRYIEDETQDDAVAA